MGGVAALFAASWIVLLTMLVVCSDAFLPFVPSGTMVIAATLDSKHTHLPLIGLLGCVALASFTGDLLLLRLARRGAGRFRRLVERRSSTTAATASVLEAIRTKRGRTVVVARFVPGGRTVLDLAVGTAHEPPMQFVRWSAVSATVWATYICGLGWLNQHAFDITWLSFAVSCAATTAVSAVIARVIQRRRRAYRAAAVLAASGTAASGPEGEAADGAEGAGTPANVAVAGVAASIPAQATGPTGSAGPVVESGEAEGALSPAL